MADQAVIDRLNVIIALLAIIVVAITYPLLSPFLFLAAVVVFVALAVAMTWSLLQGRR